MVSLSSGLICVSYATWGVFLFCSLHSLQIFNYLLPHLRNSLSVHILLGGAVELLEKL